MTPSKKSLLVLRIWCLLSAIELWVCCVVMNAIKYWDASERKGKISRVPVVTRLPVNLILRIWFLPVELHNWLVWWLGGCSCKTSYEANREGRPGLAIQHSCLCLSHTSMNDRWNNFGPRVFQGNKKIPEWACAWPVSGIIHISLT